MFDPACVAEEEGSGWNGSGSLGAPGVRSLRRPWRHHDEATRRYAVARADELGVRAVERELDLSHGIIRYWRERLEAPESEKRSARRPRASVRREVTSPPEVPQFTSPRPRMGERIERRPFDPERTRARGVEASFDQERS